jgi:hypothetical protein
MGNKTKFGPHQQARSVIESLVTIRKCGCVSTKLMRYTKGVRPQLSKNVKKNVVIRKKKKIIDWSFMKGEVFVVKDDINYR